MLDITTASSLSLFASPLLLFALVWTLAWKGVALWKAARNGSRTWFIALLVVNTIGVLEILYIFVFSKMGKKSKNEEQE